MEKPTKGTLLGLKLIQDWLKWQLSENEKQIAQVEKQLNESNNVPNVSADIHGK